MFSTCGCAGTSHLVATPDAEGGGGSYVLDGLVFSDVSTEAS